MKAMILAAGRGERMRPLTDCCPKPMLTVMGKPLIEYHIIKLAQAGIKDIVINIAWLGEQIENYFQDGSKWGVTINYSVESDGALETAGGIIKALPILSTANNSPFLVVNGDVFTDFNFDDLPELSSNVLAHLWLVKNPEHNVNGDFSLERDLVHNPNLTTEQLAYTYSGIGLYRASFFDLQKGNNVLALGPLLREKADCNKVSGQLLVDHWTDVGTPERLVQLNKTVEKRLMI